MKNKSELRDKIEKYTQIIRERLNLSSPLNMIDVMQSLNISCTPVEDVDYDAKLLGNKKDGYYIYYDKNQIFERQQFSIAHEFGHLLLHRINNEDYPNTFFCKNGSNSYIEWEANEFAASLLMPRDEFVTFCINNVDDFGNIDLNIIASNFGVSKQAARVRGRVLNLWKM